MANWIKLADITNGSASHELDTGDWANPDNYRYLYMQFWTSGTNSSGADLHCQFNGDTSSSNYQYRWARAIATSMNDNSDATYDNIQLENADYDEGCFVTAHIVNHKTTLKTLISKSVKMGADANNDDPSVAPNSMETSGKWRNNSTSINRTSPGITLLINLELLILESNIILSLSKFSALCDKKQLA